MSQEPPSWSNALAFIGVAGEHNGPERKKPPHGLDGAGQKSSVLPDCARSVLEQAFVPATPAPATPLHQVPGLTVGIIRTGSVSRPLRCSWRRSDAGGFLVGLVGQSGALLTPKTPPSGFPPLAIFVQARRSRQNCELRAVLSKFQNYSSLHKCRVGWCWFKVYATLHRRRRVRKRPPRTRPCGGDHIAALSVGSSSAIRLLDTEVVSRKISGRVSLGPNKTRPRGAD